MENFKHNPLGINNPVLKPTTPDAVKNLSEKVDIKVRLATPEEWPTCKELRLMSITGPAAKMMGITPGRLDEEMNKKTDEEWQKETSSKTMFSVLSWIGSQAVGLGRAKQEGEGVWRIRNGYVRPEFENMGIQQKMIALRLSEIIKNRGGVKAVTAIRLDNPISFHNAKKFGFKGVNLIRKLLELGRSAREWHMLESDLTNPDVIKKIDEVLNAR